MKHRTYFDMSEDVKQECIAALELRSQVFFDFPDSMISAEYRESLKHGTKGKAEDALIQALRSFIKTTTSECKGHVTTTIHLPYVRDARMANLEAALIRAQNRKETFRARCARSEQRMSCMTDWYKRPWWKRIFRSRPLWWV